MQQSYSVFEQHITVQDIIRFRAKLQVELPSSTTMAMQEACRDGEEIHFAIPNSTLGWRFQPSLSQEIRSRSHRTYTERKIKEASQNMTK